LQDRKYTTRAGTGPGQAAATIAVNYEFTAKAPRMRQGRQALQKGALHY
jgi:hypothetical protein